MAIYHCSIKIGGRANGQSAIAAAAYRAGDKLEDKETGLLSDYSRKGGVVFSEISLCANAPAEYADRATLWNSVHEIEKAKNAQLWREFEVALPKELSRAEQIDTVRDFVKGLTEQGMCVDWSLHDKGDGNPHAHIMATMRSIKEDGKWAPKSRKVYDLDEFGLRIYQKTDKSGRKQYKNHKEDYNDWNKKERVEEWRAAWAACCNERLAERDRIDHRSYARQGVDQIPTIHEGYAARRMLARGKNSDRAVINEDIRTTNEKLTEIKEKQGAIITLLEKLLEIRETIDRQIMLAKAYLRRFFGYRDDPEEDESHFANPRQIELADRAPVKHGSWWDEGTYIYADIVNHQIVKVPYYADGEEIIEERQVAQYDSLADMNERALSRISNMTPEEVLEQYGVDTNDTLDLTRGY